MKIDNFDGGGGDFKDVEAGTHPARIVAVWDCGIQKPYSEDQAPKQALCIVYEVDEATEGGERLTITEPYNVTLGEKAKLRGPVLAALPDFPKRTAAQRAEFVTDDLLGAGVMITVSQKPSGKMKVSAVAPLPKGLTAHEDWGIPEAPFGLANWMIENQMSDTAAEKATANAAVAKDDNVPF